MTPQLNKETNLTQVSQQDSKEIYTIYLYLNKLQVSIRNLYVYITGILPYSHWTKTLFNTYLD